MAASWRLPRQCVRQPPPRLLLPKRRPGARSGRPAARSAPRRGKVVVFAVGRSCAVVVVAKAAAKPRALRHRHPGRAMAASGNGGLQALAADCRYGAYTSNKTSFPLCSPLASVPCVCTVAAGSKVRDPEDEIWLIRCVSAAIFTLVCAVCVGSVSVISTVCVIVGARLLHMRTGPEGRRGRRAPACPGAI